MTEQRKFDTREINQLVIAGAKQAWVEKEPIALIGLLMGVLSLLLWPLVEFSATAGQRFQSDDPAVVEALRQELIEILPFYLFSVIVSLAVNVMLARLATRGRQDVFTGGLPAFAGRLKWVFWRYLAFTGWLLLGLMALWMAGVMVGVLLALFGINAAGAVIGQPSMLLAFILLIPAVFGTLIVYGALGLTVISESSDHHLTIKDAWICLKGQRIKLAAAILVAYLAITVLIGSILARLILGPGGDGADGEETRLALSLFAVATAIVTTFYTFVWFSMTNKVAEGDRKSVV